MEYLHKAEAEGVARYYIEVLLSYWQHAAVTVTSCLSLPELRRQFLTACTLRAREYNRSVLLCVYATELNYESSGMAISTCSLRFRNSLSMTMGASSRTQLPIVYQGFYILCDLAVYFSVPEFVDQKVYFT